MFSSQWDAGDQCPLAFMLTMEMLIIEIVTVILQNGNLYYLTLWNYYVNLGDVRNLNSLINLNN
jgi:hypothetical protein